MITAEFLNEGPCQAGIPLQICELFRVLEEGDDAQIDHADHGCVAGDQEEECELHRVFLGDVTRLDLVIVI